MVKNKCLICGKEWESRKKGKWCSGSCWNKAHRDKCNEARRNFNFKNGGETKYQQTKKKWIGTIICDKCGKKGRAYILFRKHCTNQNLHIMHFKGKNKDYDYDCYLGVCDDKGNQINEGVKDDGGF